MSTQPTKFGAMGGGVSERRREGFGAAIHPTQNLYKRNHSPSERENSGNPEENEKVRSKDPLALGQRRSEDSCTDYREDLEERRVGEEISGEENEIQVFESTTIGR